MNNNIVVASNRGPALGDSSKYASGGLVQALLPSLTEIVQKEAYRNQRFEVTWYTCNISEDPKMSFHENEMFGIKLNQIEVTEKLYEDAYGFIANRFLWFLHHGLFKSYPEIAFDDKFYTAWNNYRAFNELFARSISETAAKNSLVLIQDYHLSLVPKILKHFRSDLKITHFSHIPFASMNDLKNVPKDIIFELLTGLNPENTAAGFHTPVWEDRFKTAYKHYVQKIPNTFSLSLGVDAIGLTSLKESDTFKEYQDQIKANEKALIVRSDRLEPSKNILNGFLAFEQFLIEHIEYLNKVQFKAFIYPSRTTIYEYKVLSEEVQKTVKEINNRFKDADFDPIELIIQNDREVSLAALSVADIIIVNSVADGMNLVVKEAIVLNNNNCSIILSVNTGAYYQFQDLVIGIDPMDLNDTANAFCVAINQDPATKSANLTKLKQMCNSDTAETWFEALVEITAKQ